MSSLPTLDVEQMDIRNTAILVVIPTLNEAEHIENVLAELSSGIPAGLDVRFVVCDGGSSDSTQEIVQGIARQDTRVVLLHNAKRLQSAAVNHATRTYGAGYDILIRCDAHSVYPSGYVASLVQSLAQSKADAVVVPMDSIGDTCLRKAVAWVSDTPAGSGGSAHRGGTRSGYVDHGHHAAFRMASFVRAGGYDESFSHNEDAELDCRQRVLGGRIFLDASIRIGYVPRNTLGGLWRQYRMYGRGRARTVCKHPNSLRVRQFAVPLNLLMCLLGIIALPWTPWAAIWPAFYVLALCGVSGVISIKKRSLCGLLAFPAAFVMHTSWALGFLQGFIFRRDVRWSVEDAVPLELNASNQRGPASITAV
jgi:succinoglycan biosynthesis protein ExoA